MPITVDLKDTRRMPCIGIRGNVGFYDAADLRKLGAVYRNKRTAPDWLLPEWRLKSHYDIPAPMMRRLFDDKKPMFMRDWHFYIEEELPDDAVEVPHAGDLLVTQEASGFYELWTEFEGRLKLLKENNEDLINTVLGDYNINGDFFAREPKIHQRAGLAFFLLSLGLSSGHICLFDEMRTGKTKQAIDIARHLLSNKMIGAVLIVCPNSIKRVWYNELKIDAPLYSMLTTIIEGTKKRKEELWNSRSFFYIVNYEGARADEEFMQAWAERKAVNGGWMLICDEAHKMKNPAAQQTRAIMRLNPDYSVLMTGTPVANRPEDAFTMTDFVCPGILGQSVSDFQETFGERGGYKGKEIVGYKISGFPAGSALNEVRYRLARISMRRLRRDVVFSEMLFQTRVGVMNGEQKRAYEEMRDLLYTEVANDVGEWTRVSATSGFAKAIRLVQITGGYLSPNPEEVVWFSDNWKLNELDEFIEEYLDDIGKLVIWSRFVPVIEKLVKRYSKHGAVKIRGQMKRGESSENMYRFQQDRQCKIMVCNILTAEGKGFQPATFAIMWDKWLSPHLNKQARDRIVGIENPVPVTIISFVTEDSIDERMEFLLEKKQEWADAVTGDKRVDELHLPVMDKKTLLYLLAKPEEARKYEHDNKQAVGDSK